MKVAYGRTYKEAVVWPPQCGLKRSHPAELIRICQSYPVVLDFRAISGFKYRWECRGPFCYYVKNTKTNEYILDTRKNGDIKPKYFKTIRAAMQWIYDNNKEYFDKIPNLTMMTPEQIEQLNNLTNQIALVEPEIIENIL